MPGGTPGGLIKSTEVTSHPLTGPVRRMRPGWHIQRRAEKSNGATRREPLNLWAARPLAQGVAAEPTRQGRAKSSTVDTSYRTLWVARSAARQVAKGAANERTTQSAARAKILWAARPVAHNISP